MKIFSLIALFGLLAAVGCSDSAALGLQTKSDLVNSPQTEKSVESSKKDKDSEMNLETATFAGGCFWCTEAVFLQLDGVESVMPGYMGGHVENPTYEQVCGKKTGHAEVIQIKYDPEKVSFEDLLFVFFKTHDPTTLNRQGNDVGPQYRSAVFYHDDKQKASAEEIKKKIDESKYFPSPIVTEITKAATMYDAEDYHVNYFANNPGNGYCQAVIPSKLKKLKEIFGDKLKSTAK
jgi:peptide-methionine (S)-S-oxide reductase